MEILDIIIFDSKGKQIVSKSEVFKENSTAAGFLPLIDLYMTKLTSIYLPSLILEKHKILFQRMRGIIGAIVLNNLENENIASELLQNLLRSLLFNGIENANRVIKVFFTKKAKELEIDT